MKLEPITPSYRFPARSIPVLTIIVVTLLVAKPGLTASASYPVARVNGTTIYQSDLSCAIEASLARELSSSTSKLVIPEPGDRSINDQKVLEALVNIELLYQESLKHRFHGLAAESEERYQAEVKRIGGEDKLKSALQCNNMSPEQFRKSIFRNLSIKRFLNEHVHTRIEVTQEEIREYYELNRDRFRKPGSIRISQILIKAPPDPKDQSSNRARNRAFKIYRNAVEGEDFVRLVRKHSEDPVSASAGGDLGLIQKDNIHGIFDTVIFTMKAGSVTKPIRSYQGFHILKINSIIPPSTKEFEEVQEHITTLIRRQKVREMTRQVIHELREKAEIEILLPDTPSSADR